MTYGDIFKLWQFVLSWIIQAAPTPRMMLQVNLEFAKLGQALVIDTGIENFHEMSRLELLVIGPATRDWLKNARPILYNTYPFFGDRIEAMLNPTGKIPGP